MSAADASAGDLSRLGPSCVDQSIGRFSEPPDPAGVCSYDELAARLGALRAWSGQSYRQVHRRVVRLRAARGVIEIPTYNTVYRCMQLGRRRLDVELVVDIATVLLGDPAAAARWRWAYQCVAGTAIGAGVVDVRDRLPEDLDHLVGRAGVIEQVVGSGGAGGLAVIEGMAGVGKTTLAVRLAHELSRRHGADLCLMVNLRGYDPDQPPVDPAAVLGAFLRRLGLGGHQIHPLNLAARAARFRQLMAGRSAVLLLDDATATDQVRPLLPDDPCCHVLITSRHHLSGLRVAHRLVLTEFSTAEAVSLLRKVVGRDRVDAEPEAAAAAAGLVGRLPLAIALLAARIAATPGWTVRDHLDRLRDRHAHLQLDSGVDIALTSSYAELAEDLRHLLRLVALHPGRDIEPYAAAALAAVDVPAARDGLASLAARHLLHRTGPDRYNLHDLVRIFAMNRAHDEDAPRLRQAAIERLLDMYRATTAGAMDRYAPSYADRRPAVPEHAGPTPVFDERAAAASWLDSERVNLLAAAQHAAGRGWSAHVADLTALLAVYLDSTGRYGDAVLVHRQAIEYGTPAARGRALCNLGTIYVRLARYDDAAQTLGEALTRARAADDRLVEREALTMLGWSLFRLRRYDDAVSHYRQALAVAESAGRRADTATALQCLGAVLAERGGLPEAQKLLEQALVIAAEDGHAVLEATVLGNLGLVHERRGDHGAALAMHHDALNACRERGYRMAEACTLNNLGTLHSKLGQPRRSIAHHRSALLIAAELDNREFQAEIHNDLADSLRRCDRPATALRLHEHALRIATDLGDRFEQARAHDGLTAILHSRDDIVTARSHWQEALRLYLELGTPEAAQLERRHPEWSRSMDRRPR